MTFQPICRYSFMVGELRKSLNWAADSTLADALLQGKVPIHTMSYNKLVHHVLRECKQTSPEISEHITTNDLKQLFKKWRESTTTSQSGRHLGIHRAIFLDQSDSTKKHSFDTDITSLINILIRNGMGLDQWRNVTNMMIHKLEGFYNINKL